METRMNTHEDHYTATLEDGSLVMTPHCACGNTLNDDYFCEKCNRRCHCNHIVCDTQSALDLVQKYIRTSSQFAPYRATLASAASD